MAVNQVINQNIPFLPDNEPWEDWNGSMLEYFGQEPIPYVVEEEWKDFAMAMIATPTFANYALPGPEGFERWQDWVMAIIGLINGPTSQGKIRPIIALVDIEVNKQKGTYP